MRRTFLTPKSLLVWGLVLGSIFLADSGMALAARFSNSPSRPSRTDIGRRGVEDSQGFSAFTVERLRRAFFVQADKGSIPAATRKEIYRQQRRLVGRNWVLNSGQPLPADLRNEAVFIPGAVSGFFGLNGANLRVGILGTDVFLYNAANGRVQDVLSGFLFAGETR